MDFPKAKILIVDDDKDIRLTSEILLKRVFGTVSSKESPEDLNSLIAKNNIDVVLLDMNYSLGRSDGKEGFAVLKQIKEENPLTSVVIITAYGDVDLAVKAMKLGAQDFIVKPWNNEKFVATVASAYKYSQSEKKVSNLEKQQRLLSKELDSPFGDLIGTSQPMQHIYETISKIAKTDANVLILGENGTGKELVARAIHRASDRTNSIFVNVDLGAIAETLFESELFGHKKGAFTDAVENRIGRFEVASGGTIFLDEIANLALPLQAKLLSAIQKKEIYRVGDNHSIPIDIRLICATNAELYEMVYQKTFREDLLYRINTIEIQLPPLRKRTEDIPLLTAHFLKMYLKKYNKNQIKISDSAIDKFKRYQWPGNIRELQHIIERAVILADSSKLTESYFMFKEEKVQSKQGNSLNIHNLERNTIVQAINKHNGNISQAAKELGLGRTTLYRKMQKYGL